MTLKQMVERLLIDMPITRNSDIALTLEIWKRYYPKYLTKDQNGVPHIPLSALYDLPREDNVKRIRAQFNADGKYYPTVIEVVRKRKLNEDIWRKELGYRTNGDTLNPTRALSYTERLSYE